MSSLLSSAVYLGASTELEDQVQAPDLKLECKMEVLLAQIIPAGLIQVPILDGLCFEFWTLLPLLCGLAWVCIVRDLDRLIGAFTTRHLSSP